MRNTLRESINDIRCVTKKISVTPALTPPYYGVRRYTLYRKSKVTCRTLMNKPVKMQTFDIWYIFVGQILLGQQHSEDHNGSKVGCNSVAKKLSTTVSLMNNTTCHTELFTGRVQFYTKHLLNFCGAT